MSRPVYTLRLMQPADIEQVSVIDRRSFPTPWSQEYYQYEVSKNSMSEFLVLALPEHRQVFDRPGLAGWLQRLGLLPVTSSDLVVGYAGMWHSGAQAHISTIAIDPDYRGLKLGELLLAGMVCRAIVIKAGFLGLEARVSNMPAITLYEKYEFQTTGIKPHYYSNDGEDARDMRLRLDAPYQQRFAARWGHLQQTIAFEDQFTRQQLQDYSMLS